MDCAQKLELPLTGQANKPLVTPDAPSQKAPLASRHHWAIQAEPNTLLQIYASRDICDILIKKHATAPFNL